MNRRNFFREIYAVDPRQDYVIDAVRALSVLSIIVFHVVVGIIQIYDFERAKQYILNMPSYLQPLWHGEKGVDAFFLISALVLGVPLFKRLDSFDLDAALAFYKKRFFRIYPLFFVALLIYTAAQWSYFGKYFFSNLFLINNLIPGERTIIPVGWSLLVEIQYYALLPFFIYFLRKSAKRAAVLWGLVGLSVLICMLRLAAHPQLFKRPLYDIFMAPDRGEFRHDLGELFYEANSTRFGAFAVGLCLAYFRVFHHQRLSETLRSAKAGVLLVLFAGLCLLYGSTVPVYHPDSFYSRNFSETLNMLYLSTHRQIFAAGVAALMLGAWYSPNIFFVNLRKLFSQRLWIPFSRLSFPIYLFHFPFIAVAAVVVFGTTDVKKIAEVGFFEGFGIFGLAAALALLFSIPLYIYVERPFIELGKQQQNQPKV